MNLLEMTSTILVKFGAVVVISPIFVLFGVVVFVAGGLLGQIYIKAQLSVKREMSNAKAPVLGHFSAAIQGLSMWRAIPRLCNLTLEQLLYEHTELNKNSKWNLRRVLTATHVQAECFGTLIGKSNWTLISMGEKKSLASYSDGLPCGLMFWAALEFPASPRT